MRIAVFLFALAASASLLPAVAHAQEPNRCNPDYISKASEGSISGQIFQGTPPYDLLLGAAVMPVDPAERLDADCYILDFFNADEQGYFSVTGLVDGEYFVVPHPWLTVLEQLPECVQVLPGRCLPALRVVITNGEAVTGIVILARAPEQGATISGRILVEGQPRVPYQQLFGVIPAEDAQPIPHGHIWPITVDGQGNFTMLGLPDGDYYLVLCIAYEFAEPPGVDVFYMGPGGVRALSGVPLTIVEGEAHRGLEIVVSSIKKDAFCLDYVEVWLPAAGAGPSGADGVTGRVAVGLGVAAALLLAGGVALRARSRRVL